MYKPPVVPAAKSARLYNRRSSARCLEPWREYSARQGSPQSPGGARPPKAQALSPWHDLHPNTSSTRLLNIVPASLPPPQLPFQMHLHSDCRRVCFAQGRQGRIDTCIYVCTYVGQPPRMREVTVPYLRYRFYYMVGTPLPRPGPWHQRTKEPLAIFSCRATTQARRADRHRDHTH